LKTRPIEILNQGHQDVATDHEVLLKAFALSIMRGTVLFECFEAFVEFDLGRAEVLTGLSLDGEIELRGRVRRGGLG